MTLVYNKFKSLSYFLRKKKKTIFYIFPSAKVQLLSSLVTLSEWCKKLYTTGIPPPLQDLSTTHPSRQQRQKKIYTKFNRYSQRKVIFSYLNFPFFRLLKNLHPDSLSHQIQFLLENERRIVHGAVVFSSQP